MSLQTNSWNEWSQYVLKELERHNDVIVEGFKESNDAIKKLSEKILIMETKMTFIAGIAGLVGGGLCYGVASWLFR